MNKIEKIKVWVFYLKNDNRIYAFTSLKKYKERFIKERNEKCFYVEKIEIDEFEFSIFLYRNSSRKLSEFPLNTSLTEYVTILMTPKEYEELNHQANIMDDEIERIRAEFNKIDIKSKFRNSLNYLCSIEYFKKEDEKLNRFSTINLLFLFMQLFKNTFEVSEDNT